MESHHFESPINTFTLDLGWSKEMKNLLQQLKGVKSISIDPNEGKVTVVGDVNPMMLIKLLQKIGKRAHLRFDKSPMQSKTGSYPKHQKTSHCCCESGSEDDSDEDSIFCDHIKHKVPCGQRRKRRHRNKNVAPPPAVPEYHPPMPWYQPEPVAYAIPSIYATPNPWTWYGYYGQDQPMFPYY